MSSSNGLEHRPKLRFPEFDESWNPLKFGNIIDEFKTNLKEMFLQILKIVVILMKQKLKILWK